MKPWSTPALLFGCLVSIAPSVLAADFSGKWQMEFHTNSSTAARPLCTFEQKENHISGVCKGPHSEGPVSGAVNGSAIEFTWKTGQGGGGNSGDGQMHAGGGVWTFRGTLAEDNTISGSGTAPTGEKGQFTAKRP
jgi:hypothetical protein